MIKSIESGSTKNVEFLFFQPNKLQQLSLHKSCCFALALTGFWGILLRYLSTV